MSEKLLSHTSAQLQGFDDFIQASMQDWKGPGLAIAVIKEGEVVYSQGFGLRDKAQGLPVTAQTLFPIASCTKAFTTASLSILADQGKLDWDTPVIEYIPNFRLYDPLATQRVTPRDLVSHRTGLPRHDMVWYQNLEATRQNLVERLQYLEPTKDFRSFYQYQNLMFMAAGYLVEKISGQSWEEFVQQHIFQPLEMNSSNFDIVTTAQKALDYSHAYQEVGNEVKEIPLYGAQAAIGPAGAIVSNIAEMSNWVRMHLNQGQYKGHQLISASQVKQLHTPQMVMPMVSQYPEMPYASYALGWSVKPYRGYSMIAHSGGIDGFRSLTTLFPTEQIGVVVLSNIGHFNVPEILTYNAFERLTGLNETPWRERFLKEHFAFKEAEQRGREQSEKQRVAGASPSHALEAYTGVFKHPGYGLLSVTLNNDQLQGKFNNLAFSIQHYHYDTFDFLFEEWEATGLKASFLTNVRGDIETLIVPFEPTGSPISFKRIPGKEQQDRTFLEQFVGIYEFVAMQIVVSLKGEHTLNATIPGQPTYELECYKGSEFLPKGISGVSIEFQHDSSGSVVGATVTLPDGVFQAAKKA